jgi:putative oxidoreductase
MCLNTYMEDEMTTTTAVMDGASGARTVTRGGFPARVLGTSADFAPTVARVVLGAVMLPHGAQKLLGGFGGYGWSGTMGFLTGQAGLPWLVAALVILIESVGAVLLVAGLGGRIMAAGVAAIMVGAVATVHFANGFFMNWAGNQPGEGFEYHLLAIALAVVVMLRGSGAFSLDRALTTRD